MAALNDLIQKIENPELRAQIQAAADRLTKQKKFGLVFEDHLPECTPLYDIPVRKGGKVSVRKGKANETYLINNHKDTRSSCEIAYCYIMDYLKQNQHYFPKEISEYDCTIKGYCKNNKLVIFKDIFEDMLRWINLDPRLITKEFDSIGILEHEKDRLSKRVVIDNSKHTMYVIKTDYDFGGEEAKSLDAILKGSEVSLTSVKVLHTGQRRKLEKEVSA